MRAPGREVQLLLRMGLKEMLQVHALAPVPCFSAGEALTMSEAAISVAARE